MLDRLDDALEPVARSIGGRAQWSEMKENAVLARDAGCAVVLGEWSQLKRSAPGLEIHLVGHSAGSILLGGLAVGGHGHGRHSRACRSGAARSGRRPAPSSSTGSITCRQSPPAALPASTPGATQLAGVINGFSELILEVFGPERGAHSRSAVGMAELPFGVAVEIEAEVEIL